jgi:tetratricopeptide (TPR) repeat protein
MRNLQISIFSLITALFFLAIPTLWLGLRPNLSLVEFLSGWQIIGTFTTTVAIYAGIAAYIFGWNPQSRLSQWFREKFVLRLLNGKPFLKISIAGLISINALCILFLYSFQKDDQPKITAHLLEGNYEAVDRELGSLEGSWSDISELFIVNDSIRQEFFSTSNNADASLCRLYTNYLTKRNHNFTRAWRRYFLLHAQASCVSVLENPVAALLLFEQAAEVSRWISNTERKRVNRKIANVYFRDHNNQAGLSSSEERYRKIIRLLGADSDPTAQRMVGSSYYLLGEYQKAAETWKLLLGSISPSDVIEGKKNRNNIALAYTAIHQHTLANEVVDAGVTLSFDEDNEKERREQIRLLSTKALVQLNRKECSGARTTWDQRNELRQQDLSKCTSLISAQVLACDVNIADSEAVLSALLIGTGQEPSTFSDRNELALSALVDQAKSTFSTCYLGLPFKEDNLRRVALSVANK